MAKFVAPVDLTGHELRNVIVQNVATDPAGPQPGQLWYDSTANILKYQNDVSSVPVGEGISPTLFNADTLLKADVDDTPVAMDVPMSTFVGRGTAGGISALTANQAKAVLGITDADISGLGALASLDTVDAAHLDDLSITDAKIAPGAAIALSKLATDPLDRDNHTGTQPVSTITGLGALATIDQVTSAEIADGTIVNADISGSAAIALSKLATDPLDRANHTGTQAVDTITGLGDLALADVVTSADIEDGTIVDADISDTAAIALSKLATDPLARANHTGTQTANTISDFDVQVRLSRLDQMAAPTAPLSLNGQKLIDLGVPTAPTDAVPKSYVDSFSAGLDFKQSVRAAAASNMDLAAPANQADGVTLNTGDRLLLMWQTDAAENGIYIWNGAGVAMTRAPDADDPGEITAGMYCFVEEGTTNGDKGFVCITDNPITIGTTPLYFTQFFGGGNVASTASKYATQIGDGSSTSYTVTHNLYSKDVVVEVYDSQTGETVYGDVSRLSTTAVRIDGFPSPPPTDSFTVVVISTPLARYTQTLGDGAATTFSVDHNIGTEDVVVELYDRVSGMTLYVDVTRVDSNTVSIGGFKIPPGADTVNVTIMG